MKYLLQRPDAPDETYSAPVYSNHSVVVVPLVVLAWAYCNPVSAPSASCRAIFVNDSISYVVVGHE